MFDNVFEKKHLFAWHYVAFFDSLVQVDQCGVQLPQPLSETSGKDTPSAELIYSCFSGAMFLLQWRSLIIMYKFKACVSIFHADTIETI